MAKNDTLIHGQALTLKIWRIKWELCQVTRKIQGIWVRNTTKRTLEPKVVEVEDELVKRKENQSIVKIYAP
ncbi:hypothetical protein EPI10_001939 [Gossypium australe]|uniref:Uncharacterized protein n=1 Tax=Gossypium australe TaxID=47621 RepID=A0A5B6VCK8_9ROSI|nr:hypothetical protein EPI10_001939 [Gossypium australe]